MIRLALVGGSVVLGLAAWLGADDDVPQTAVAGTELAMAQPDARTVTGRPDRSAEAGSELSDTMIGRCLQVAHEVDPELAKRLETIRRDRSEQDFRRAMSHARHLVGLARLKEEQPKLYGVKVAELQLDAQVDRLLSRLIEARRTSSPSTAELEKELLALVERQVGYSIIARGFYLLRLEDHVKSLRDELDQDIANSGPAVQRRYQALLDRVNAAVDRE